MGLNKADEFSMRDNRVSRLAKALAHPARVAIVRLLLEKENCHCGHIVDELPLSQSTVSQHLKELKEAGLVKGTVAGAGICYCIDHDAWTEARQILGAFISIQTKPDKSCCD